MKPSVLHSVADMLSRQVTTGELLELMVDRVVEAVAAERGTLYLIDAITGELVSRIAHLPEMHEIRLPPGRGVAWHVVDGAGLLEGRARHVGHGPPGLHQVAAAVGVERDDLVLQGSHGADEPGLRRGVVDVAPLAETTRGRAREDQGGAVAVRARTRVREHAQERTGREEGSQ